MNYKKALCYFSLLLALAFLMPCRGWSQPLGEIRPKPGTRAPVVTNAFAIEKGYYGSIWKIYIEAEDPDGDMLRIASVVEQPGYGRYPTDFIYLKPQYQGHLRGYLQWNTFSFHTNYLRDWTEITLAVSILDRAGNESNVVVFPFTFESGARTPDKPPPPFDQRDLPKIGNLFIDLYEPTLMGGARDD